MKTWILLDQNPVHVEWSLEDAEFTDYRSESLLGWCRELIKECKDTLRDFEDIGNHTDYGLDTTIYMSERPRATVNQVETIFDSIIMAEDGEAINHSSVPQFNTNITDNMSV
eukprot:CAMPEP_0116871080 /NCGR_PEP_ID=MMETSP0463-20121206/1291_1 /TAXON_ID=181622 /ORGANISM="Strombidinopsis sp, Strain SopsisLIS2011" /LENGTH=111 /DNA_ID=CAMNT_0004508865 /DNA_START=451 /DNA_END=786 /DNA_ORIENTATION=+